MKFISDQPSIKELKFLNSNAVDTLTADKHVHSVRDQCLLSYVGNLSTQPEFELLQLQQAKYWWCTFTMLLNSFLSSQASKWKALMTFNFEVEMCECDAWNN